MPQMLPAALLAASIVAAFAASTPAFAADEPARAAAGEPIPVEDFIRHARFGSAKLSPNGKYIAITTQVEGQNTLAFLRTDTLAVAAGQQLPDEKSIGAFHWVGPERLMFTALKTYGRNAAPSSTGEWYAMNADGSDKAILVDYNPKGATERGRATGNEFFTLLDPLPEDASTAIMQVYKGGSTEGAFSEVVALDTFRGTRRTLARSPRKDCDFALDEKNEPRWANCNDNYNDAGKFEPHLETYRREADGKWTLVNRSQTSGLRLNIIGTAPDGRVYAEQDDRKAPAAFGLVDKATGKFTALHQDKVAEIVDYLVATDRGTIFGVVTMAGIPKVTIFDEPNADADVYAALAQSFPGKYVDFTGATLDGGKIMVAVRDDSSPTELYLYDRATNKSRFLLRDRDWLDPERMASVKPFSFKTRDGHTMYGYLTVPKGAKLEKLPMIVHPHGGPIGPRDAWGFNWETQMLASRGYLVLQLNFRGSGGYGQAFTDLGHGEWGGAMQDDLTDVTKWAVEKGYADPERICIYGASYGGYASLMGVVKEPDLYNCAVGYVGVYDLMLMKKKGDVRRSETGRDYMDHTLGEDKGTRLKNSPAQHAAKIKAPVFLAAGMKDERTPYQQTEAMRDALKAAGHPADEVLLVDGEGHGFYKEANNLTLYTKMLAFFDRYIGERRGRVNIETMEKADAKPQPAPEQGDTGDQD
jgi:dipeptidyl aminopeptidase/acylaminoacyl peptidase